MTRIRLVLVLLAAFFALMLTQPAERLSALSFNGATPLNVNTSDEICNDLAPPLGTMSDHNACGDNVTNGANVPRRLRTEWEDGSVLATEPMIIAYSSGLVLLPGTPVDETVYGDYVADIDFFCDGDLDQLATTAVAVETTIPPRIATHVPPAASYFLQTHSDITLVDVLLSGTIPIDIDPLYVNTLNLRPEWSGVAAHTYGLVSFFGTGGHPPAPDDRCRQNPMRSTVNIPGTLGAGTPYFNPTDTAVVFWEITTSEADYYDGLRVVGPTGGTNERSGVVVPAGILRNVQCVAVGASSCPAENSTENSGGCNDGGLWEDTDDDGLPDLVETRWGSDCTDIDTDNDGMTDFEEMAAVTNPRNTDTDADGSAKR